MAKQTQPELEQERDGVGEEVQETGQSQDPIADGALDRQPEKPKAKVNLDEFDEFRKVKSEYDRKIAQLQKDREDERRYLQQQAEEARRIAREKQLAEMDDYQRAVYERDEALQLANQHAMQLQQMKNQIARESELNNIAAKFGVPREAIEEATSRAEALELAWEYQRAQEREQARARDEESEEKRAAREQRKQANKVDTGSGIGATPKADWEREYEKAKASKDSRQLARLLIPD